MGSYDGAEVCELVESYFLSILTASFGDNNIVLYRDDGLVTVKGARGCHANRARKSLHEIFNEHGLRVTAEINDHIVNFPTSLLTLRKTNLS